MKKINNDTWLKHVQESILDNPSIIPSVKAGEDSFLKAFYDTEGVPVRNLHHIMTGVVEEEEHYKNLFFDVFYNRVVRLGIIDTLQIPNKFDVFYKGELTRGIGWSRTITDIMEDEEYSRTGSPIDTNLDNTVGKTVEVFSDIPKRRLVAFTIPSLKGINEAFLDSDYGIDELLGQFFTNANKTIEYRIDTEIRDILKLSNEGGNVFSPFVDVVIKKSTEGYDITTGSVIDGTATLTDFGESSVETGLKLSGLINNLVDDMTENTRKFNKGDSNGKFMQSISKESVLGIFNSNALRAMEVRNDAFFGKTSQIYSSFGNIISVSDLGNITATTRTLNNKGEITNETYAVDDNKIVLGIIAHPEVIEYKFLMQQSTDFFNARTLDHNHFRHFWYGTLSNPFVPAVRLILDTSEA